MSMMLHLPGPVTEGAIFIRACAGALGFLTLAACATAPAADAPAAQAPPAAPSRPAINPDDILGQRPDALDQLLGAPSLTRREGQGEFRRYARGDCTLIVIVYPDDKGEPRVAHLAAAARASGAAKPAVEDCLAGAG